MLKQIKTKLLIIDSEGRPPYIGTEFDLQEYKQNKSDYNIIEDKYMSNNDGVGWSIIVQKRK